MNKQGSKLKDKLSTGLIIGIIAPVLGFCIYGMLWAWYFNKSFAYFYSDVFVAIPTFRSSILTLSLVFNLVPFFILLNRKKYRIARGILMAVFIYIPFVVYFRFFN